MATYRGTDGHVTLGGYLYQNPLVQGAVSAGASSATFDATTLRGALLAGDTFTVGASGQVYTIAADTAASGNEIDVTFTPVVISGGWADNAAVNFTAASLAQVTAWEVSIDRDELDTTVMGSTASTYDLDIVRWTASATVLLDYDDTEQAELIDQVIEGTAATALTCTFGIYQGRLLYGSALVTSGAVQSQRGAIVTATLNLRGTGAPGVAN